MPRRDVTVIVKDEEKRLRPPEVAIAMIEASRLILKNGGDLKRHERGWYVTAEIETDA